MQMIDASPSQTRISTHPAKPHPANAPAPTARPQTQTRQTPARDGMVLENEIGLHRKNPPWALVEKTIRELDPGHFNSFACLSLPGNTYVQGLRGFNGWHLEWRLTGATLDAYLHFRACYRGVSAAPFELKKSDFTSPGQHRDLLKIEDVIDSFRAFHQAESPPAALDWRDLEI